MDERGTRSARTALSTNDASKPLARYSQGIVAAGLVFAAGQGAHDPVTNELPDGIEEQTRRTLENVDAILRAGGASLGSALKLTVYLADRQDYAAMNAAYDAYLAGVEIPGVRTTVQAGLGRGMLVEIDAIALAER